MLGLEMTNIENQKLSMKLKLGLHKGSQRRARSPRSEMSRRTNSATNIVDREHDAGPPTYNPYSMVSLSC